jgi:hypothetical protein
MGNQTLDVTKPEVRQFTTDLINEFAPLFSGHEFHIAADEYPGQATMDRCPELADYAHAHGFGSTADVFVDFINQMNGVVRSHGKRMVIWNWWDVNKNPTIAPDKTIKVETWTTAATGGGYDTQHYLDEGYDVVASPSDTLYVTPGSSLLPNPKFLYEQWQPIVNPHLDGYQISVWSDNRETAPDAYFDAYLRRPREVVADRLWGGPNGAGQIVKAANHMIVTGTIGLVAESLVFLEAHGIDTTTAVRVLANGMARSAVLEKKAEAMINREFEPGFRAELHHKDLGIAWNAAREAGVAIPLGSAAGQLVASLTAQRAGHLDHGALITIIEQLSGRAGTAHRR